MIPTARRLAFLTVAGIILGVLLAAAVVGF